MAGPKQLDLQTMSALIRYFWENGVQLQAKFQ